MYTHQCYTSYRFADSLQAGQRNCPEHVEFYSRNKFEKLVHLVGGETGGKETTGET